jgi:hypothetical protein
MINLLPIFINSLKNIFFIDLEILELLNIVMCKKSIHIPILRPRSMIVWEFVFYSVYRC